MEMYWKKKGSMRFNIIVNRNGQQRSAVTLTKRLMLPECHSQLKNISLKCG